MIGIHWGIIRIVSGILYILMLLTLPFSVTASTMLLFTLIAFWSRLPGVAIVTPLWILYMIDVVDLFSMLVAINVGGIYGAVIAAFCNFVPRIAGITPPWSDVVKDTIIQPIICLIIPFVYSVVNDITACMIIYTLLRQAGFFFANFIYPEHGLFPKYLVIFILYTTTQTIVNYMLSKYFGGFFNNVIASGVGFNWILFLIATIVVLLTFVFTKKSIISVKLLKGITRNILKNTKKESEEMNMNRSDQKDELFFKQIEDKI
jgi:hypothetical protein